MWEPKRPEGAQAAGFAIGIGLVFVATLGVYWHFAAPTTGWVVWGLGSFAIGAAVGAAIAVVRRRGTGER
jgi:hypothetical protein